MFPEWLGTPLQGLSATALVGILAVLVKVHLGRGELSIKARQVTIDAEKVEADIEGKLRTHFAEELKRLAEDADAARTRQHDCEQREEKLRMRVRKLEADYDGVMRVIAFNSSALLLASDGSPSEAVRDAAVRVLEALARGEKPILDAPGETHG